MTRKICILLTALLLLSSTAFATTLTIPDVLTLTYPNSWANSGADDSDDVEGEYYNLGFICGVGVQDLNVSIDLYYFPEYADLRLFELEEQDVEDYAGRLMEDYTQPRFLGIRWVSEHRIPFAIMEAQDSYGPFIIAETLTNGWDLCINGYAFSDSNYDVARELTDDDVDTFLAIVDSIEPIVN